MAQAEFDEKHRYYSKWAAGYVTAPQYLTEMLCVHVANQNREQLPDRFWQTAKWKKFYQQQIHSAFHLLESFDMKAILQALADNRSKKTRSLRSPYFQKLVRIYQGKIDLAEATPKELREPIKGNGKPREPFVVDTVVNKLRKIDHNGKNQIQTTYTPLQ